MYIKINKNVIVSRPASPRTTTGQLSKIFHITCQAHHVRSIWKKAFQRNTTPGERKNIKPGLHDVNKNILLE